MRSQVQMPRSYLQHQGVKQQFRIVHSPVYALYAAIAACHPRLPFVCACYVYDIRQQTLVAEPGGSLLTNITYATLMDFMIQCKLTGAV